MSGRTAAPVRILSHGRKYCRPQNQYAQLLRRTSIRHSSTSSATTTSREWSTPLAKNLAEAVTTTGPISIAKYMRECLTSPIGGYYTTQTADGVDQFGRTGDFVTSPEISQIFGELVGIWFVAEWMSQGKPSSGVELIELGPGRGTLMDDMLRAISKFKPMADSIQTICLVEASPTLRAAQHKLLCENAPLEETASGYQSKCKYMPHVSVVWAEDINFLPKDAARMPFMVAHEFFDALPIHAFTSVPQKPIRPQATLTTSATAPNPQNASPKPRANEWRELLVSPTAPPSQLDPPKTPSPEFELSVAPVPTPYSSLLPSLSSRYAALLPTANATIEICPEARTTAAALAQLIGGAAASSAAANPVTRAHGTTSATSSTPVTFTKTHATGAALIIDYGPASTIPVNTLRGIRAHKTCSPFEQPGRVDLSADVDFSALVETALAASDKVAVHGPVEQAAWLSAMGGKERCEALLARAQGDEIKERISGGWNRLVSRGPDGMGKVYKVMAIVPEAQERRPVGFGGDVA